MISMRPATSSTLFPYTTLFRSRAVGGVAPVAWSGEHAGRYDEYLQVREQRAQCVIQHQRVARRTSRCRNERYGDRKSTRLNSSHVAISYAVVCLYKTSALCEVL